MATTTDAELVLKLYDLRREATLRRARVFVSREMVARTTDDLLKIQRGNGTEENTWWRMTVSYWEMAASFVLRGALDGDLFLDSVDENIFIYTKFHQLYKEATGADFMPRTAQLIAKYPAAAKKHENIQKRLAGMANLPEVKAEEAFARG